MRWQEEFNQRRLKTPGWYGCIAPDGWKNIVEDADRMLSELDPFYEIHQVKEKFGTLRFYYGTSVENETIREIMDAVISYAEMMSARVCDGCGNSSYIQKARWGNKFDDTAVLKATGGGWFRTVCNSCDTTGAYEDLRQGDILGYLEERIADFKNCSKKDSCPDVAYVLEGIVKDIKDGEI